MKMPNLKTLAWKDGEDFMVKSKASILNISIGETLSNLEKEMPTQVQEA